MHRLTKAVVGSIDSIAVANFTEAAFVNSKGSDEQDHRLVELVRMKRNRRLQSDEGFGLHNSVLEHRAKSLLEGDTDSGFVMLGPVASALR